MKNTQAPRTVEGSVAKTDTLPQLKHLLLVDDNKALLQTLVDYIGDLGFNVTVADNGLDGFRRFSELNFDLVNTYLNMPGLVGWQLTTLIKAAAPDIPVLMITGDDRVRVRKAMDGRNVNPVLFKPFHLGELIETIRDLAGMSEPVESMRLGTRFFHVHEMPST